MSRSMKKNVVDLNFDCLSDVVRYLDKHRDFLSVALTWKGFYEYVVNMFPSSCSNIVFRMGVRKVRDGKTKNPFFWSTVLHFPSKPVIFASKLTCKIPFTSKKSEVLFDKVMKMFPNLRSLNCNDIDSYSVSESLDGGKKEKGSSKDEENEQLVLKSNSKYLKELILSVSLDVSIIAPFLENLHLRFPQKNESFGGQRKSGTPTLISFSSDESGAKLKSLKSLTLENYGASDKLYDRINELSGLEELRLFSPRIPTKRCKRSSKIRSEVKEFEDRGVGHNDSWGNSTADEEKVDDNEENNNDNYTKNPMDPYGIFRRPPSEVLIEEEERREGPIRLKFVKKLMFSEHPMKYFDNEEEFQRSGAFVIGTSNTCTRQFDLPNLETFHCFRIDPMWFSTYPFGVLKVIDFSFSNEMSVKKVNIIVKSMVRSNPLLTVIKLMHPHVRRGANFDFSGLQLLEVIELNPKLIDREQKIDYNTLFKDTYRHNNSKVTVSKCPKLLKLSTELFTKIELSELPSLSILELRYATEMEISIPENSNIFKNLNSLCFEYIELVHEKSAKSKIESMILGAENLKNLEVLECQTFGFLHTLLPANSTDFPNSFPHFMNLETLIIDIPYIDKSPKRYEKDYDPKKVTRIEDNTEVISFHGFEKLTKLEVSTGYNMRVSDLPNLMEIRINPPRKGRYTFVQNCRNLRTLIIVGKKRFRKCNLSDDSLKNSIKLKNLPSLKRFEIMENSYVKDRNWKGRKVKTARKLEMYRVEKIEREDFCGMVRDAGMGTEVCFGLGKMENTIVYSQNDN